MNKTSIEWTHRPETGGAEGGFTWNPIRARLKTTEPRIRMPAITQRSGTFCTRISPGCTHCYASTINKRFGNGLEFTVPNLEKIEFFIDEKILAEPLKRKKPATIFVGDMFDLFHEAIDPLFIGAVFGMMLKCPQHTFQVLTKRTARMRELISPYGVSPGSLMGQNIWLGTSVESPDYEKRIVDLLATPAAIRYLSIEPQLAEVNAHLGAKGCDHPSLDGLESTDAVWECNVCKGWFRAEQIPDKPGYYVRHVGIDWVICGGESGHEARPFNLAWAESLQAQCEAANVAFFMKQIGSNATYREGPYPFRDRTRGDDRKGGDPAEWPEHLRVRQFPSPVEKLVTA